ncbi:MAG: cbb3-type cytochrome c oxidase N-terminal domain-containing protein [Gemmatimonadaceae bacterium]
MADNDNDKLLEHAYDGIQEYDNPLPTWWKWIFYATILVVPIYMWDPMGIGVGPGKEQAYTEQMAAFTAAHPKAAGTYTDDQVAAFAKDPAKVEAGKVVYTTYCVPCHRPDGGGLIGPNLTDDFWIHGGKPTEIMKTVVEGVLAKGMPNWGKMLKPDQVEGVVGYVQTLHGTNPANPKAPEGAKYPADSAGAVVGAAEAVKKGM